MQRENKLRRWCQALVLSFLVVGLSQAHAQEQTQPKRDANGLLIEPVSEAASELGSEPGKKPVANTATEPLEEMHFIDGIENPDDWIHRLPPWVQEVTSVCPWRSKTDKEQQGYIRLIRTQKEGGNELYIQWIQRIPPKKDEAMATRKVVEVTQGPALIIELPEQELHSRFCTLTAYARRLDNNADFRIKLKIQEPGEYEYERIQVLSRNSR